MNFRRSRAGLFFPAGLHVEYDREPGPPPHWLTTVGFAEITGQPKQGVAVVRERLTSAGARLEDIIHLISRVSLMLDHAPVDGRRAAQELLLKGFLGPEAADAIWRTMERKWGGSFRLDNVVFFHERQLLALARIAFETMPIDFHGPVPTAYDIRAIGLALLMLNDIVDEDVEDPGRGALESTETLELYMFANTSFNRSFKTTNELVRTHAMYVEANSRLSGVPEYVDLEDRLLRAARLSPDIVWHALFGLFAYWRTIPHAELMERSIGVSRSKFFELLTPDADTLARVWSLAETSAEQLQIEVRAASGQSKNPFDVLAFERHPLVSFGDHVYCVSSPLLARLVTAGFQHRFLMPSVFSKDERGAFLRYRGRLFEDYTDQLLSRVFGDRFIPERVIRSRVPEGKVCDGIVVYGDAALVFEYKAALLPLAARQGSDYAIYAKYVEDAVGEAAGQLAAAIHHVQSGALIELGVDPVRIRRYFPIVLTLELTTTEALYRHLANDIVGQTALAQTPQVAPIQLMEIVELETLETAVTSGRSAVDLVRAKTATPETCAESFNNHWFRTGEPFAGDHNPVISERFDQLLRESVAWIQAHASPGAPEAEH